MYQGLSRPWEPNVPLISASMRNEWVNYIDRITVKYHFRDHELHFRCFLVLVPLIDSGESVSDV